MKSVDFMSWKARIPDLDDGQRQQAMASLKLLGVMEGVKELEQGVDDNWFTAGLLRAIRANMLTFKMHERKSKQFLEYKRDWEKKLGKHLLTLIPEEATSVSNSKTSLAYIAGVSLIQWCEGHPEKKDWYKDDKNIWRTRPLIGIRVIERAHEVVRALDNQFPGYIRSNIFGQVFKALLGAQNDKGIKRNKDGATDKLNRPISTGKRERRIRRNPRKRSSVT